MKLDNKEFKELMKYDYFLSRDILNNIKNEKFDVNTWNSSSLLELRYVVLINFMTLFKFLDKYMRTNNNIDCESYIINGKYLSEQYFKYLKSTEDYWTGENKILQSFLASKPNYYIDGNNNPLSQIENIISLLLKLITIEGYLLIRAENISKFEVDYERVIKPFLEKQLEIRKAQSLISKGTDKLGYFGKNYFNPKFRDSDKRLELSKPSSYKFKNADELYLAVSFSESQAIINKKELKKFQGLSLYLDQKGLKGDPSYQKFIELSINNNIRTHKSVIASIIFTSPIVYDITTSFLNCKLHNPKGLDLFQGLYIEHIFIIKESFDFGPKFFRKEFYVSGKKQHIYVNYITLKDLCILYSTLDYLNSIKKLTHKKGKFNPDEVIYLSRDLKIDTDILNSYFYNLIDFKRSILLFNGYAWSKILESFYSYGIEISGGSTTKRHILSPKDLTLASFVGILQSLTSKKVVISNYLVDEKLYKSQFVKPKVLSYNNNHLNDLILNKITILTNESIENLNKTVFSERKLDTNPFSEDYYDVFNFILNYYLVRLDNDYNLDQIPNSDPFVQDNLLPIITNKFSSIRKKYKDIKLWNSKDRVVLAWANKYKKVQNVFSDKKFYSTNTNSNPNYISNLNLNSFPKNLNLEKINKTNHNSEIDKLNLELDLESKAINNSSNLIESQKTLDKGLSSNDIFYESLVEILQLAKISPEEAQAKIEEDWIEIMYNALLKKSDKIILNNKIKYLYKETLESFNTKEFQRRLKKNYSEIYKSLLEPSLLLLTMFILIDSYTHSSQTMIGHNLGKNIMVKIFLKNSKKSSILTYPQFMLIILYKKGINIYDIFNNSVETISLIKKLELEETEGRFEDYKNLKTEFYIKLGLMFMSIFYTEPVSLFKLDYKIKDGQSSLTDLNKPLKLYLSEEYENWAYELKKTAVIQPKNIPMVCEPRKWSTNKYGGYLTNKNLKEEVITGSIAYHGHQLADIGKVKLFKTINYFNSIKFGINNSLLNYLNQEGNFLLKDLNEEDLANSKISLKLAELYKDIPFYITTHADWRGRIYTNCFYLSYQGSEMATALLQFWEGFSLTREGLNKLCNYGATLYSDQLSKENSESKKVWLDQNKKNILKMEPDFIKKADSPLLFAAFCLEMQKLEKDSKTKIFFPVFIDATCSGIQHLSAMVLDSELASLVNLTIGNKNKPEDIYNTLVEPINKAINEFGAKNPEFSALKDLYLDRKILKRPIMTQNYNVSIFGMKEQLYESLSVVKENNLDFLIEKNVNILANNKLKKTYVILGTSKEGKDIILTNKDLFKVSMIIKEVIFLQYPVLKDIYDYFIDTAKLMENLNLPVQWLTPTGAIITQEYKKSSKKRIRVLINKKSQTKILRIWDNEIDHKKQKDGIIPNVIHSLDSSHIINLIVEKPDSYESPIVTVHDCFGTHPNYIDILQFRLKEEFISLYVNNKFLKLFQKRINQYILDNNFDIIKDGKDKFVILIKSDNGTVEKLKIPKPPIKNNFDINKIQYSKYMFC